ncbi:MAG: hypothetical protein ABR600_07535 [Actinomycetota bacterium]
MTPRRLAILVLFAFVAAACGRTVLVQTEAANPAANRQELQKEAKQEQKKAESLSKGGSTSVNVGATGSGGSSTSTGGGSTSGGGGTTGGGTTTTGTGTSAPSKCATNSDPAHGFTEDSLTLGTIIPLTGSLKPLGSQTYHVMQVAVDATLNQQTHIAGPYADVDWGCPSRDGVFGRHISLKVFSLQDNTPEEALAGMRRLIDVEHVFLVRDCYLESNLMGAAVQYQNSRGVPAVWCFFSGVGPELAPWNYAPGTNPNVEAAIHTAYEIEVEHKTHLAILSDPSVKDTIVKVIQNVASYLKHPIPDGCIQYKRAQDASSGEDAQVAALRTCYGATAQPDAVMVSDALNLVFGALSAKNQGWRGADNRVTWDGVSSDWIESLAKICTDACAGAITDCQALPCIPWASAVKYPAVKALQDTYNQYLSSYPEDILTYGPEAITGGLGLWLGMTGPDLSAGAFRNTLAHLNHWDAGIGPVITMSPQDHFGGAGVWLIKFTGNNGAPYFDDITHGFLTLQDLHIPTTLTET